MGCTAFTNREYTPWGDSWFEYSNMDVYHQMNIPFRFTGKEIDMTQLYYYGARYYSPAASVWMSPDPILGQYLNGKTNNGVYNSKNLSLFAYVFLNPVGLIDRFGLAAEPSLSTPVAVRLRPGKVDSLLVRRSEPSLQKAVFGAGGVVTNGVQLLPAARSARLGLSFCSAGLSSVDAALTGDEDSLPDVSLSAAGLMFELFDHTVLGTVSAAGGVGLSFGNFLDGVLGAEIVITTTPDKTKSDVVSASTPEVKAADPGPKKLEIPKNSNVTDVPKESDR